MQYVSVTESSLQQTPQNNRRAFGGQKWCSRRHAIMTRAENWMTRAKKTALHICHAHCHMWAPRAHRRFRPPHDLSVAKLCRFTSLLAPASHVAVFPSWIAPCWQTLASAAATMPSRRGPPLGSTGFMVFACGPPAPTCGRRRPRGAQRCTPAWTHQHPC
jgi:hypothetical protein